MKQPLIPGGWGALLAGVLAAGLAAGQERGVEGTQIAPAAPPAWSPAPAQAVPLDRVPAAVRDRVRRVVEQPTLFARGPAEEFGGSPEVYHWFLDHPDRVAVAWRRLGAPCMEIGDRGNGKFGWVDGQGSDLAWETVYSSPQMRIWYAEGSARPGSLLPLVPVRAVVVLRHRDGADRLGRTLIRHQAEVFLQTDSKTASLITRLIGPAAPRLVEQGAAQLELFFSGLAWYLDRHPERTEKLLSENWMPERTRTPLKQSRQ
jgi:hypothetical protein